MKHESIRLDEVYVNDVFIFSYTLTHMGSTIVVNDWNL